jgi:uncharacterized protein (TIGR02246 family)
VKRTWSLIAAAALVAVVGVGLHAAPEKKAPKPADESPLPRPEEAAIREASQAFARAFETGDAKALAGLFTREAEFVEEGGKTLHGRAELAKAYAAFFARRTALTASARTTAIRFLGRDVAVEEGVFTVHSKDAPRNASRYSSLFVRQDGRWLIAMLKEWGDAATERPTLEDLAWLIGTWEADGPEYSARTDYQWSEHKKFIRCDFKITQKKDNKTLSAGTQVIGVDPAEDVIRSWLFDTEGGIGETSWTWDGDQWVLASRATLGNGLPTTATNFLSRKGDDTFAWRSVQRTLGDAELPDIGPVTVKRVAKGK